MKRKANHLGNDYTENNNNTDEYDENIEFNSGGVNHQNEYFLEIASILENTSAQESGAQMG